MTVESTALNRTDSDPSRRAYCLIRPGRLLTYEGGSFETETNGKQYFRLLLRLKEELFYLPVSPYNLFLRVHF